MMEFVSWDDYSQYMEQIRNVPNHHFFFVPLCMSHCLGVRRQCFDCGDTLVKVASKPEVPAAGQAPETAV